jgi:hypothetical protein
MREAALLAAGDAFAALTEADEVEGGVSNMTAAFDIRALLSQVLNQVIIERDEAFHWLLYLLKTVTAAVTLLLLQLLDVLSCRDCECRAGAGSRSSCCQGQVAFPDQPCSVAGG